MQADAALDCEVCGDSHFDLADRALDLWKCRECGFFFRSRCPSPSQIAAYYSQYNQYDDWLTHESVRDTLWRRRLRMVERYGRKGRLLDVGTGIGQFLEFARRSFEVEGTEVSSRALEIARCKYGLNVRHGTIEEIDFGERRFEVITVFHVLEHVVSPRALLLRCRELLVDGGLIVIAVPNEILIWKRRVKRLLARIAPRRFSRWAGYELEPLKLDRPGLEIHLSHFTNDTLRKLLMSCGFKIFDEDLDPCHALNGFRQMTHDADYQLCRMANRLIGLNLGEAIWMAAVKTADR